MPTRAISKKSSLQPNPCGISPSAISKRSSHKRNPVRDCRSMSLAQKDQLLEIGSRARLGKPIICRRLSVSSDKSPVLRPMKFEQIFSLRCQTEQAGSFDAFRKLFLRMTLSLISTRHQGNNPADCARQNRNAVAEATILGIAQVVEPDGIEPTTSCLQSRRSPS